ncbi:MAG: OmpA family protein [Bacteroidia bacterium]
MKTNITLLSLLLIPAFNFAQFASNKEIGFYSEYSPLAEIAEKVSSTVFTVIDENAGADNKSVVESILNSEMSSSVVFFDFNKIDLTKSTLYELNRISKLLTEHPAMVIEVTGYTDNIGSDMYNDSLSHKRTGAIVYYLINQSDIDAKRISVKDLGESEPIADNKTEEGRGLNRRVEMKLKANPSTD